MRTAPLLGYYAASSGNFLPTFRYNLSIPSAGDKNLNPCSWDRQFIWKRR